MRFKLPEIPPPKLITALRNYNLLPAIVFMPTRRRCDEAALEVAADRAQRTDPDKERRRQELFEEYLAANPEIKTHKHRKIVMRAGVAAHHAGHIPAWKLLVEKMMSAGLLDAIFATSTVAAGVDFPARTVVVTNADIRGNDGWRSLNASELQQMTGRAGRRGKDNVGFVVLAPSNFQNPPKVAELLKSAPDPLNSQFRATYTSLLNLLDAFKGFAQVRDIAERSFAFRETSAQVARLEKHSEKREKAILKKLAGNEFGFDLETARAFERLTATRLRLQEKAPHDRIELRLNWLRENVVPGRVVTKGNTKRYFLVLNVFGDKVVAMREDGSGATLSMSHLGRVFSKIYKLSESTLDEAFDDIHENRNPLLEEPKISKLGIDRDAAIELLSAQIDRLLPDGLSDDARRRGFQLLWETWDDAEFLQKNARDVEILRSEIWLPFERRARVLDHFGYLDFAAEKVTERGKWLADLRVDRPLLVGEALRHGLFDNLEPKHVAALTAALAADSDRNFGELYLSDPILDLVTRFEDIIYEVSGVEWKNGVDPSEEINLSAAAAAEHWADGLPWEELVFHTKAEEGDLVRLLSRTGEALMQIAQLRHSNPDAAFLASRTADLILREPIR
ncbi:MAG: hypothetical protein JSS81_14300 [Acidobacteria bacterium]|nr:hypothetical protein [Acidobacteriota bacterium]